MLLRRVLRRCFVVGFKGKKDSREGFPEGTLRRGFQEREALGRQKHTLSESMTPKACALLISRGNTSSNKFH